MSLESKNHALSILLQIPLEIFLKITEWLRPREFDLVSQSCRQLRKALWHRSSFEYQAPLEHVKTLPESYPRLTRLYFDNDIIKKPIPPWSLEHLTLQSITTNNLWLAENVFKCPHLQTFRFSSRVKKGFHQDYLGSHLNDFLHRLLPKLKAFTFQIHAASHHASYLRDFNGHVGEVSIPLDRLESISLVLRQEGQELSDILHFLSCFQFPNVTQVELGCFWRYQTSMRWKEFVPHLSRLFPSLQDLNLHFIERDALPLLPKGLRSLYVHVSDDTSIASTPLPLSSILDQQEQLSKLSLSQYDGTVADDLQGFRYPQLKNVRFSLARSLTGLERFPNLQSVEFEIGNLHLTGNFLAELSVHCTLLESLKLVVSGTQNQFQIDGQHKPVFPNLKRLRLISPDYNVQNVIGFLSRHSLLEELSWQFSESVERTDSIPTIIIPDDNQLPHLKRVTLHTRLDTTIPLFINSPKLAMFSLSTEDNLFIANPVSHCVPCASTAIHFPLYWPQLRTLHFQREVTENMLQEWIGSPNWRRNLCLQEITFSIPSTIKMWTIMLRFLERHRRRLEFCRLYLKPVSENQPRSLNQLSVQETWDLNKSRDRQEWTRRVREKSHQEVAEGLCSLISFSRESEPFSRFSYQSDGVDAAKRILHCRFHCLITFELNLFPPIDQ